MSPGESRWVPGLIHLHSKFSDGRNTIEQLKRLAQARGYRFMIVTDHADMVPRERFAEYVRACTDASEADFLIVPGLEISTGWVLPNGQDDSTAHTLALDITDALDLFNGPGADWSRSAARHMTAESVHDLLRARDVPLAAAHQFQYAKLKWSLSEPLAGADYRYDMAAVALSPGIDFYYRTVLELDHEPEDQALHTGMVSRWLAAGGPEGDVEMPWAYTGCDYHAGWCRVGPLEWTAPLAKEQLSHATWVRVRGEVNRQSILGGIRARRTCATRGRDTIIHVSRIDPHPGLADGQPPAGSPGNAITLDVTFPRRTTRPMFVHVYRDGVEVSGFRSTYRRGIERLVLNWDLPTPEAPQHAYTVVIAGKLVTSSIVVANQ
jgi:hypothetical protein